MTLTQDTTAPRLVIPSQPSAEETELRSWKRGVGRAIASGAELFTGYAPSLLHLPLPIQRLVVVDVRIRSARHTTITGLTALPKAEAALTAALEHLSLPPVDVRVSHRSDTPAESGMAAATTDITATLRALFAALTLPEDPSLFARLATQAGAPGGLMYPGLVLVDESSTPVRSWSTHPRFAVTSVAVPTSKKKDLAPLSSLQDEHARLLSELDSAMASSDPALLAGLSTRSAMLCHEVVPHALFAEVLELAPYLEAADLAPLGYALAHDREALCLLYPDGFEDRYRTSAALRFLQESLPQAKTSVSVTVRSS